MDFAVRHRLPGRLRIAFPSLKSFPEALKTVTRWIGREDGVTGTRVNRFCASIVIEYHAQQPGLESRLVETIRNLDHRTALNSLPSAPATENHSPSEEARSLAVATSSLPLSLLDGPVTTSIAGGTILYAAWPKSCTTRRAGSMRKPPYKGAIGACQVFHVSTPIEAALLFSRVLPA